MSTQLTDSYPLIRAMLENAAYAFQIHSSPELNEIFLDRHTDAASLKKTRDSFKIGPIKKLIRDHDETLGTSFDKAYENAINYGGHPNIKGLALGAEFLEKTDGSYQTIQIYLHSDPIRIAQTMLNLTEAAISATHVLAEMLKLRKSS